MCPRASRDLPDRGPSLRGPRTLTRLAADADVDAVLRYWRDNGQRYDPPLPPLLLDRRHWLERSRAARRDLEAGVSFKPYVFDPETLEVLGTVQITTIQPLPLSSCRLGYGIGGAREGQGYMQEAVRAVIGHVFGAMNLHRIEATHAPDNLRSARLLERLGFRREGVRERSFYSDGRWNDSVVTALLNEQWRPPDP
jgi:ribosomal-protein-alanine N-acetyltransferase